jgi:hypothetical protein
LNIKAFGHLNIKFGFLRFPTGIPTSWQSPWHLFDILTF